MLDMFNKTTTSMSQEKILICQGVQINSHLSYEATEIKKLQFKLGLGSDGLSRDISVDWVAFILDSRGKLISDSHFVFYNSDLRLKVKYPRCEHDLKYPLEILRSSEWDDQFKLYTESRPTDPEMSVIGPMEYATSPRPDFNDDAEMDINLEKVHSAAYQIIICAYSYHCPFGETSAYLRLYNSNMQRCKTELFHEVNGKYPSSKVLELCRIFKNNNIWKIQASNRGYPDIMMLLEYGFDNL